MCECNRSNPKQNSKRAVFTALFFTCHKNLQWTLQWMFNELFWKVLYSLTLKNKGQITEHPFFIMTSPFLKDKDRIFENTVGFVIYDKFLVNKGHCLIVPAREYGAFTVG